MNNQARRNELFTNGPIGIWVKILGPKNSRVIGVTGLALVAIYAGLRLYIGQ